MSASISGQILHQKHLTAPGYSKVQGWTKLDFCKIFCDKAEADKISNFWEEIKKWCESKYLGHEKKLRHWSHVGDHTDQRDWDKSEKMWTLINFACCSQWNRHCPFTRNHDGAHQLEFAQDRLDWDQLHPPRASRSHHYRQKLRGRQAVPGWVHHRQLVVKMELFLRHTFHRSANFSSALRATPRGISHRQTDLLDDKRSWIQWQDVHQCGAHPSQ